MGITPTPVAPNTPIVDSDVRAELERIRNWVNAGMVVGDMPAGEVTAVAIYRPETYGFPKENTECVLQRAAVSQSGIDEPSRKVTTERIATLRERKSIFVTSLGPDDAAPIPKMSKREFIAGTADVEISASWRAITAYENTAPPPVMHPAKAGAFVLMYQKTTDATPTTLNGSFRRINAQYYDPAPAAGSEALYTLGSACFNTQEEILSLSPGYYDFWLEYRLDGGDDEVEQVIVVEQNFVVEVHQQ